MAKAYRVPAPPTLLRSQRLLAHGLQAEIVARPGTAEVTKPAWNGSSLQD
jgi:hypothetical protein